MAKADKIGGPDFLSSNDSAIRSVFSFPSVKGQAKFACAVIRRDFRALFEVEIPNDTSKLLFLGNSDCFLRIKLIP